MESTCSVEMFANSKDTVQTPFSVIAPNAPLQSAESSSGLQQPRTNSTEQSYVQFNVNSSPTTTVMVSRDTPAFSHLVESAIRLIMSI